MAEKHLSTSLAQLALLPNSFLFFILFLFYLFHEWLTDSNLGSGFVE